MKITLLKLYTQVGNLTPIGNSTINAIGCLTVDAAMVATYFGHPIDPSTLAKSVVYAYNLPNNQGVRTLWDWPQLTKLYPDIIYQGQVATPNTLTDNQINQIKDCINKGFPVFLLIKTPTITEHWLLAVDYSGEDFLCADPLKNPAVVHPITDYGISPRTVIYAYAWYTGKLPVSVDPLQECLNQHQALVTENVSLQNQLLAKKDYIYKQSDLDTKVAQAKIDVINKIKNYLSTV